MTIKTPNILITNDDGIHSPGLYAATQAAMKLGEVTILSPSFQQTAMGRCLKGDRELVLEKIDYEVEEKKINAFHCDASPALVVQHGLNILYADEMPDLLISGINYGENLGINITTSGTIGAAYEGSSRGIPALAISLQTSIDSHFEYTIQDWSSSSHFLSFFAKCLLSKTLPFDLDLLKVDVPQNATEQTPWRLTKLSRHIYYSTFLEEPLLNSKIGDTKLKINTNYALLEKDSDIFAVAVDRVVSVTPLSLDSTSRSDFQKIQSFLNTEEYNNLKEKINVS